MGSTTTLFAHTLWATMLVGVIQILLGAGSLSFQKKSFGDSTRNIAGAVLFGLLAWNSTVLGFVTFWYEGEFGARVFVITLSVVPGALIDHFCFSNRLNFRQWSGVLVAILAGFLVLGSPALRKGIWIWFAFANMMTVAVNQGVTQAIKDIDPMRKNFYGGIVAVALGLVLLGVKFESKTFFTPEFTKLTAVSILTGLNVVFMWTLNVWAYKDGAYISLKKIVLNSGYLSMSMVIGVAFFGDAFAWGKIGGMGLFVLSLALMDNELWKGKKKEV
ncbi:MAG: hypothetical protein AAB682_03430 [Patescibacteria group bacterium]